MSENENYAAAMVREFDDDDDDNVPECSAAVYNTYNSSRWIQFFTRRLSKWWMWLYTPSCERIPIAICFLFVRRRRVDFFLACVCTFHHETYPMAQCLLVFLKRAYAKAKIHSRRIFIVGWIPTRCVDKINLLFSLNSNDIKVDATWGSGYEL